MSEGLVNLSGALIDMCALIEPLTKLDSIE
jgi:hypothetical protein